MVTMATQQHALLPAKGHETFCCGAFVHW